MSVNDGADQATVGARHPDHRPAPRPAWMQELGSHNGSLALESRTAGWAAPGMDMGRVRGGTGAGTGRDEEVTSSTLSDRYTRI